MSKLTRFPLEFAEIDGVVKDAFWTLISQHAEFQRTHLYLYEQIEQELEWVNINEFNLQLNWPSAEERWLHQIVRTLVSSKPPNVIRVMTYVIRFNGALPGEAVCYNGIPPDVYFVQIYGYGPYPMNSLRDLHLRIQSMYSLQLAIPPPTRRGELRLILLHLIAAFPSNPDWIAVYNFLYN